MMTEPFGEHTAQAEIDELRHIFIPDTRDRRVEVVLEKKRCPILGRRGAGKTALAQYLENQVPRTFAEVVKIDLLPLFKQVLNEVERSPAKERTLTDDIAQLWKLTLWTAVMERLVKQKHLHSVAVTTFLGAAHEHGASVAVQVMLDGLAGLVRNDGGSLLDWTKMRSVLEDRSYSRALEDTKNCLAQMDKIVLIIDSFDDVPVKTECMSSVTIGLLTAANSGLVDKIAVKCFFPTEVWVRLRERMPNVGHFNPFEVRWSPDDLIRLLSFRLNQYLWERELALATRPSQVMWESPADVRAKVWGKMFPAFSQAPGLPFLEMPEYLVLRHTQLRPRQAIILCNSIANQAWQAMPIPDRPSQRHGRCEATAFKPHHITNGIAEKLESICIEARSSYAYVDDGVRDALRHFLGSPAVKPLDSVTAPDNAWTTAYRLGAIGPVRGTLKSMSRSFESYRGVEFEFCHREPIDWRPSGDYVAVHPLFHKQLGIEETFDTLVNMRGFWISQPLPLETW